MRLEARFWIRDPMNGVNNIRSDINRIIWRLFREHGVKIPVAQREIRILGAPDGAVPPAAIAAQGDLDLTRRMRAPIKPSTED
jgi:small-conductance mechanosensitive channel